MGWHSRRIITLLTVTLLLTAAAQAADWPVPRGPAHELAPYQYDAKQWKQVPKAFLEDAPACILYSGITNLVEPDGTVETITHELTRFNGRKGIEKLGEYRNIAYDPAYQILTLNEARVHKADGRAVPIEPKHAQLRDLSTDYQVYDHDKQLIISFPNLEVGDTIEVKWTVRGKNPEHQGNFFTRYTFGDDHYPVVVDELRVRLPKARTLKYAAIGGKLEPDVREDGDFRVYHWRSTNRRELPQDESLPSKEDLRLQVACSTFASWDEVNQWKQKLRSDCWECSADVRKVVQEVTRELKTPADKARALTYWVRRNIRYVSEGEKHDYTPHVPGTVFANRFGDCKDQSQLLAVMLREAGLPVALATLGTLDDGQVLESVPSPWGTHAIVLVTLDGQEHWVDTTLSLAAWDFLPRDDRDRLCYVVDDKGLRLVRTPPMTPESNRTEQTTHLTIGADGSSRSVRNSTYHGTAALTQRDAWMEVPPGERRRLLTSELQDANSRTRLVKLTVDEAKLRDFDEPVSARVVFEIPGHFTGDADHEGSLTDSKVWGKLLAYNLDYDREVALDLWAPFESRHRYVVQLPPAFTLESLPRDQAIQSPWGSFSVKVRADPDEPRRVEMEFHTRLEKTRIEPADFEAFHKFHEDLIKHYRVWLTLKPAHELADVPALEAVLALAPDDSASAAVLARLYQQHGQMKDARRVLQRARAYSPNEATLWELTVKAAETLEEEEGPYRELMKRFPDEPKYAVALGATLVSRGKHAEARTVLEPITKGDAESARAQAHYQLARSALLQDQPDKALKQFEAAAAADADSVGTAAALQFKGKVYEKLSKTKEAILVYRQALTAEAESAEALGALVRLELAGQNRSEALDYLRRYTVAVGEDADGLLTAADFYLRLGRYDDAFDLATHAGEQGSQLKAQRILGLVELHRGKFATAVNHLGKAGGDGDVLEGLIRGNIALGKLREADRQATKAAKVAEPSTELKQAIALAKELTGRRKTLRSEAKLGASAKSGAVETAIDHFLCAEYGHAQGRRVDRVEALLAGAFAEGVEIGPAYALRGSLALEKVRLTKALADADRAVSLSPKAALGYYVRGRVRLERAQDGALADLTQAVELSGRKDATALHWQAAALARAGRHEEALTAQREAVKLKPGDAELAEQLRELEKTSATGQRGGS